MTHKAFIPAPYKLIPFDPVPFFLAIAGIAIFANLLVLLGVLMRSLNLEIVQRVEALIQTRTKKREISPSVPVRGPVDGAYEMDVGIGGSESSGSHRRGGSLLRCLGDREAESLDHIWGPGGAAMRN